MATRIIYLHIREEGNMTVNTEEETGPRNTEKKNCRSHAIF